MARGRFRGPYKRKQKRNLPRLPRTKVRIKKEIGPLLRRARLAAGLTQAALGVRIGVGGLTVCRWELGRFAPTRRNFEAIVAHLRTIRPDVADYLWGEATGNPAPAPPPPSVPALRAGVLELADVLDASPRRARAAVERLFAALVAERFTLAGAHGAVEAWIAEVEGRSQSG
ncbi:MAG: helix-turn-helix transcriptional regulator [Polyangiaceae bacterium]